MATLRLRARPSISCTVTGYLHALITPPIHRLPKVPKAACQRQPAKAYGSEQQPAPASRPRPLLSPSLPYLPSRSARLTHPCSPCRLMATGARFVPRAPRHGRACPAPGLHGAAAVSIFSEAKKYVLHHIPLHARTLPLSLLLSRHSTSLVNAQR